MCKKYLGTHHSRKFRARERDCRVWEKVCTKKSDDRDNNMYVYIYISVPQSVTLDAEQGGVEESWNNIQKM